MYVNSRLFLYFQIKTIYLKTFKVTITNVLAKIMYQNLVNYKSARQLTLDLNKLAIIIQVKRHTQQYCIISIL